VSGKKKSRNTRIEVRISIQLHFYYREGRPCATDPIEAHSQYHFTLFLAGRGAGVEDFGFDAVPGLLVGFGAGFGAVAGLLVGFGAGFGAVAGLLVGFGAGFSAVTGLLTGLGAGFDGVQLPLPRLPPMLTLRLIFALSRWSLVVRVEVRGRAHAYPGKRVNREGLPLYTCASMSNGSPILLVEGLTTYRSQKLGG